MSNLKERLARLQQSVQGVKTKATDSMPESILNPVASSMAEQADEKDSLASLGFQWITTEYGQCARRILTYDLLSRHGKRRFADLASADLTDVIKLAKVAVSPVDSHSPSVKQFRFYDTETTGLGTGAGTVAFLHTIGRIVHDELWLYQYFVDSYDAEAAVLALMESEQFSSEHESFPPVLVSFNGKSFDWPLLQNRRILHRLKPLPSFSHIDLLHVSRRLWKGQLGRVRLIEVERHILGLERLDDLPGSEAPLRYFEYINSLDAALIDPVLGHNSMDVCSLVVLLAIIADLLSGRDTPHTAETYTAMATWFDDWSQPLLASEYYRVATGLPDALWRTHWKRSIFAKRSQSYDEAIEIWGFMADNFPSSILPLVELAKYAEHKAGDYQTALCWTKCAMAIAETPDVQAELNRRQQRLIKKQSRS